MKKRVIILSLIAFVIGSEKICIPGNTVFANETKEIMQMQEESLEKEETEDELYDENEQSVQDIQESFPEKSKSDRENLEDEIGEEQESIKDIETVEDIKENEEDIEKRNDKISLQVPQKLGIMLDPFEINGKGQIYSCQYVIKNVGETAGKLILSELVCRPGEDSGVTIRTDKKNLHNVDEKMVYIEIVFGNGDAVALSSEGKTYEIWLEPGEELTFAYAGEINENAVRGWKEHDVTIGMRYSWKIEECEINKPEK